MAAARKKVTAKPSTSTRKKVPAKKTVAKKAVAKKAPVKKKAAAKVVRKPAAKTTVATWRQKLSEFSDHVSDLVDSASDVAKLQAKQLVAREKLLKKKAELAAKAELDHAKHLAEQTTRWMKARSSADAKKLLSLEKQLAKQLHDTERKLIADARAAKKNAEVLAKAAAKKLEAKARLSAKKALGQSRTKAKATPASKAKTATVKKKAASKART